MTNATCSGSTRIDQVGVLHGSQQTHGTDDEEEEEEEEGSMSGDHTGQ